MNAKRQAVYSALDQFPDQVWFGYLMALRGINEWMGQTILDDPTPADDLDAAIAAQLDPVMKPKR